VIVVGSDDEEDEEEDAMADDGTHASAAAAAASGAGGCAQASADACGLANHDGTIDAADADDGACILIDDDEADDEVEEGVSEEQEQDCPAESAVSGPGSRSLLGLAAAGRPHAAASAAGSALKQPPPTDRAARGSHAPLGGARRATTYTAPTGITAACATSCVAPAVGVKRFFAASGCAAAPAKGLQALPTRPTATTMHDSSSADSLVSPFIAGARADSMVAGPGPAKRRRQGQPET